MTGKEAEILIRGLYSICDIVRLVDPGTQHTLSVGQNGELTVDTGNCFDLWDRAEKCRSCICFEACAANRRMEKYELKNGEAYHIVCTPIEIDGKTLVLEAISHINDSAIARGEAGERLVESARYINTVRYTDPLTGLYNRRYYEDVYISLQHIRAAALLELDGYKALVAEYGTACGDALIKSTAAAIRSHIRSSDIIIRMHDATFMLIFNGIGKEVFLSRMERIRREIGIVFIPEHPEQTVTVSIGGAYRDAETYITPDLLKARLAFAKKTGNTFFCPCEEAEERRMAQTLTEQDRDIMAFSRDFHSILSVDLGTGHMETYQASGQNAEWIRNTAKKKYDEYRQAFVEKFILPEDRAWFLRETEKNVVLDQLKRDGVYYINHRILRNGAIHYYQTKFASDTKSGNPNRVLLGGHSVDAETRRSQLRLVAEERQEKALKDCIRVLYSQSDMQDAIRSLLETVTTYYSAERAYICEVDHEKRLFRNNYQYYAAGVQEADLDLLLQFDTLCYEEWMETFRKGGELFVEVPEAEDACVPAHRLMKAHGIRSMILAPIFSGSEITGFVGADNPAENTGELFLLRSVAAFTYSELLRRNREQMKTTEQLSVIAGLATDYTHVGLADLKRNTVTVYRPCPEFSEAMPGWEQITDYTYKLQMYTDRIVAPEDKQRHMETLSRRNILKELSREPTFYMNYTAIIDGKRYAYQTKVARCREGEECVLIGVRNIERERRKERQLQEQLELTVAERTKELQDRNSMLNRLNEDVIEFLGGLTEARDKDSGEHICRVKGYTYILASCVKEDCPEYGLTDEKVNIITSASALHDLGKIMIPDNVLLKPGRLTDEEFAVMKTHCERGVKILENSPRGWSGEYLQTSMDIVLSHHEKVDGRGYPRGLKGDEIPISAQIVSVADCFDALTTKRVYKDAYPPEVAFDMIVNGRCGAFSDKLMACLRKCRTKFEQYAAGAISVESIGNMPLREIERLKGTCILLAEDNEISRDITAEILKGEGAEVILAENGITALDIIRSDSQDRIDAVLTDIMMPGMDGIELTRAVRALPFDRARNLPILALTGNTDEETRERCRRAGLSAFLTKPVSISALIKNLLICMRERSEELQKQVTALISGFGPEQIEGVLSVREYTDMVQQLTHKIYSKEVEGFALLDVDINDLKAVNHLYGHDAGDLYLQNCCRVLRTVFPGSNVYRIGGDEFAVFLMGEDFEQRDRLLSELNKMSEESMALPDALRGSISFAAGLGVFDPAIDTSVASVFARAEHAMLARKQQMKEL